MFETVFSVFFIAVLIILGVFVFKALLKVFIAIIIVYLLILAGNRMFGDDWLKDKKEDVSNATFNQT